MKLLLGTLLYSEPANRLVVFSGSCHMSGPATTRPDLHQALVEDRARFASRGGREPQLDVPGLGSRPRSLYLGVLLSVACGCGPTSYMRATGAYSVAVKAATEAFGTEFDEALVQCHRREQLDRARHLVEGSDNRDIDWASHCKDIENAIELHRRLTDQVGSYAAALSTLAGGTRYDGDGPKDAAAGASALIGTFAGMDSSEAKYAGAVAEPLKLLANFVLNQYATWHIKKAISESSPAVRLMLGAMADYLAATEVQLLVYERQVDKFLEQAKGLLRLDPANSGSPRKVPPLDAIQFVRESELYATELRSAHTRRKALTEALRKLTEAEAKLEKAGETDDKELAVVVTSAVEVGKAVKTVLGAPNAKD